MCNVGFSIVFLLMLLFKCYEQQRYFWISVPLTHHYKKCPVIWTIIGLISKNPEISLSSRNVST